MIATGMRAGAAAAAAGVHLETLRYYERRGLLTAPERTLGGHRIYSGDAVRSLRVIKAGQRLGFTLTEVAELLQAVGHVHAGRNAGLQARAVAKRAELSGRSPTCKSSMTRSARLSMPAAMTL